MANLQSITQATYNSLGQPSDSSNYNYDLVVKPKINEVVNKICKGNVINIVTKQRYSSGDLYFLRKDKLLQLVSPVTTQEEIENTDTTILADTTNYSSSGKLYVGGDSITYGSKTSTNFTSVSTIDINHNSGEKIYQLYSLPNGISLPFSLFVLGANGERSEELHYCDYRMGGSQGRYYTIITDNGVNYLHVVGMSNERILMIYYINSTNMSNNDDVCIIPDDFVMSIVPDIVAGELLYSNEEIDDATPKLLKGYSALDEMYSYCTSMIKKNKQTIKLKGMDFSSVLGGYGTRRHNNSTR